MTHAEVFKHEMPWCLPLTSDGSVNKVKGRKEDKGGREGGRNTEREKGNVAKSPTN